MSQLHARDNNIRDSLENSHVVQIIISGNLNWRDELIIFTVDVRECLGFIYLDYAFARMYGCFTAYFGNIFLLESSV